MGNSLDIGFCRKTPDGDYVLPDWICQVISRDLDLWDQKRRKAILLIYRNTQTNQWYASHRSDFKEGLELEVIWRKCDTFLKRINTFSPY